MTYAHIVGDTPVTLWGLSAHERLRRMLTRLGVTEFLEHVASVPADSSVLILRGDYLYANRVIRALHQTSNVLLELRGEKPRGPVAAHVSAGLASHAASVLRGAASKDDLPGLCIETPESLTSAYHERLLKYDPPFVLPITEHQRQALEKRLFAGAYKGVTDLVTKWIWPYPAQWATRLCAQIGIQPNHITVLSLLLVIIAGWLFAYGHYGWGLLAGWCMTFLDTVDGKLARVSVASSTFGHALDHGLDIVHPPLWYVAWGVGLTAVQSTIVWLPVSTILWYLVIGYILGRLVEGAFQLWLGPFGIFCWRPIDSYHRLITARRNPNLLLLTGATAAGRPDVGLIAVAAWTVLSTIILLVRLAMASYERITSGPLEPWFRGIELNTDTPSLAMKLFTHKTS